MESPFYGPVGRISFEVYICHEVRISPQIKHNNKVSPKTNAYHFLTANMEQIHLDRNVHGHLGTFRVKIRGIHQVMLE